MILKCFQVVGAGAVGLAIARRLAERDGTSTLLVERHGAVGTETSSRNSEVRLFYTSSFSISAMAGHSRWPILRPYLSEDTPMSQRQTDDVRSLREAKYSIPQYDEVGPFTKCPAT